MRPSRDEWGLQLAEVTAQRATCLRRSVGCVLVDRHGHVLATGYNGVAAGQLHCNELGVREATSANPGPVVSPRNLAGRPTTAVAFGVDYRAVSGEVYDYLHACPGALSPSGTNLDGCGAIHAEQNALLQCRDVQTIETCYVTCSPCLTCVKMLLNTACRRIVYRERYPHTEALDLWVEASREHRLLPKV